MTSILGTQSIQHPNGTNSMTIASDGGVSGIATTLTEQATTSGTDVSFTVPNTVKVIYVGFMGFSFSGSNDNITIRLGTSSGIATSGYASTSTYTGGGHANGGENVYGTDAIYFYYQAGAGSSLYGQVTIANMGGNKFTTQGHMSVSGYVSNHAGYASLGGAITTVQVRTQNGRTFDGGAVNVTYIEQDL